MPHVYADTVYGIFYGYGYAVAQDRLFQMEMARRSTQGRVAEVLGASMVAFDKSIRGNFSPERIQRQLAALPASDRQVLDGYAAGMNAWLARVRTQPGQLMPKEFNDLMDQDVPALYEAALKEHGFPENNRKFKSILHQQVPKAANGISVRHLIAGINAAEI